jgi:hypothetical protein
MTMRRILIPAAAMAVAATSVVATSGDAQTGGGRTLAVFESTARAADAFVDNAPRSRVKSPGSGGFRLSAGDELIERAPVLDRAGGRRIGTSYSHAAVVSGTRFANATLQAQVVLALADGAIVLEGLGGAANRPFAVVGGTGAYEGARGSATAKESGAGAQVTIHLLP